MSTTAWILFAITSVITLEWIRRTDSLELIDRRERIRIRTIQEALDINNRRRAESINRSETRAGAV